MNAKRMARVAICLIILGALGIIIGTRARSERGTIAMALLFGLLYGAAAIANAVLVATTPSPARVAFLLLLGLVMAAPVYAVAEIWRRLRVRLADRLPRFF